MIKLTECRQLNKKHREMSRREYYYMDKSDYLLNLCPEMLELNVRRISKVHQKRIKRIRLTESEWYTLEDII
jgi:hypothetical protein